MGLDTWELASILLPYQSGYSLTALSKHFGLTLENAHRGLDDAMAAGELFNLLCERIAQLPRPTLQEIGRLIHNSTWPLARLFAEALPAAGVARLSSQEVSLEQLAPDCPLLQPLRANEALTPREDPEIVDVEQLVAMLGADGAVARTFVGYEHRAPQVAMLEAVARGLQRATSPAGRGRHGHRQISGLSAAGDRLRGQESGACGDQYQYDQPAGPALQKGLAGSGTCALYCLGTGNAFPGRIAQGSHQLSLLAAFQRAQESSQPDERRIARHSAGSRLAANHSDR